MIYFLSDAHLGSKAIQNGWEHQQKIIDILRIMQKDATEIYLLGDIFDFWFEYFIKDKSKAEFSEFIQTVRTLIAQGITVHFFTGNHDLWTFGELEKTTGMIMHLQPCVAVLNGKKIYMAHGDGLLPSNWESIYPPQSRKKIRDFVRLRKVFHHPITKYLFRCIPPKWGNNWGYGWAKKSRLREFANPLAYKGENQEELILFAKEKERETHHDYYIFGHRHIDLDLQIASNSRVVILGDCFKLFTYAKLDEKGNLSLENYEHETSNTQN